MAGLTDTKQGLKNVKLDSKWIDYMDPAGQALIKTLDAKYLPQAFFDSRIANHEQFNVLQQYLKKIGDNYVIHLAPLEFLEFPDPIADLRSNFKIPDPGGRHAQILEFCSYTSADCATMNADLEKLIKDYKGKLALVYKHFDRGGPDSLLAQGVECAGDQKKFFELHDAIYKSQDQMIGDFTKVSSLEELNTATIAFLDKTAKSLKLNLKDFDACLNSNKYANVVQKDTDLAYQYGIAQVPSLFAYLQASGPGPGFDTAEVHDGALTYDELKKIVDDELAKSLP